jgi:hypothetical protein
LRSTITTRGSRDSTRIRQVVRKTAKGYQIFRSVDNPNKVFVGVEFASAEEATSFRERLLASGALDDMTVVTPPTVVEVADRGEY